jgi:hypothetical protein
VLQLKHPLLVELMGCFAALLKEYKSEVEDILVADKQVCVLALLCLALSTVPHAHVVWDGGSLGFTACYRVV